MISDAYVTMECDREGCGESLEVQLDFLYFALSGADGRYDHSDEAVERDAKREGWVCKGGKHFCSEECAEKGAR